MNGRIRRGFKNIWSAETGSVTAEFALALPAVLLVFAVLLSGLGAAAKQIGCTQLAAELARLEARGDTVSAQRYLSRMPAHSTVERSLAEDILCVTVQQQAGAVLGSLFPVRATSCAWAATDESLRGSR